MIANQKSQIIQGGADTPHSKIMTPARIRSACETAKAALLAEMVGEPVSADDPVQRLLDVPVSEMRHWVGELSTSALATATAIMALEQMRRQYVAIGREVPAEWLTLIRGGVEWLIVHQNADGGWGDTVKSLSNISTTMLCRATLKAVESGELRMGNSEDMTPHSSVPTLDSAAGYIDCAGGVSAVIARYGKDRTFSVPILTHCALAGLVDWAEVISLPFELACIPAKFYAAVRLPVVSYALPALIAIGQVRFHFRPSRNPLRRWLQRWAKPASLRVLERIQPTNGGFLEATPLTSFVTMSLAAMGLHDHPVAQRGIEFIVKSARWDERGQGSGVRGQKEMQPLSSNPQPVCSWPIDTNLATWVTTLSINALGDDVPREARPGLRAWLLRQQYRVVHPYTNAAPGGWAWTDLPGGVPDADDTPGAILALMNLGFEDSSIRNAAANSTIPQSQNQRLLDVPDWDEAVDDAMVWLCGLQNRDGGWPTFCRGWGTLPFDRSAPDISAHSIRALDKVLFGDADGDDGDDLEPSPPIEALRSAEPRSRQSQIDAKFRRKFKRYWRGRCAFQRFVISNYFERTQRPDGSWLPLWFGNQHAPNDENPTYGTAKVLAAFQALGRMSDDSAVRGVRWLVENQNPDGGWGAGPGTPSSVEETALALEALLGMRNEEVERRNAAAFASQPSPLSLATDAGLSWLIPRVEDGRFRDPSPIGFYFAKLWYFEALYPLIFTVAALRKAVEVEGREP